MPCWQPPFGEIVALDMHTGDVKWRRPVGASQQYGFFMPESWGSPTIGGPARDGGEAWCLSVLPWMPKVRAYSVDSGEELCSDQVEAPAVANPSIYEYQRVVSMSRLSRAAILF
nr:hypothetical protein [Pseudescherichia vulneris]